jgi:hypothetical protein
MGTLRRLLSSLARRWADRRVARQAEIEDFVGVEEPTALPEPDGRASEVAKSGHSSKARPDGQAKGS